MTLRTDRLAVLAGAICIGVFAVGCGDDDTESTTTTSEEAAATAESSLPEPIPPDSAERSELKDRMLTEITIPDGPDWMVEAFGSLWVKRDNGGVVRVDPDTGKPLARIAPSASGGHLCQGIGATEDAIWSCPQIGVIDRIDPKTNEIAATMRIDKYPDQGRLVEAAGLLWLLTGDGEKLTAIDPGTNKPAGAVDLGGNCADSAAEGTTIWVMCSVDGLVLQVDAESQEVTGELELAGAANASVGDELWVGFEEGVAQIDPETLDVLAVYGIFPRFGGSIFAGPDSVWVREEGDRFLTQIDPEAQEIVETITATDLPSGGDVVQIGDSVWATAYDDATLVEMRAEAE